MSINAASKSASSTSSRAAAMVGAGPTTSQPRSPSRSAVNGPTTGESSTSRMRWPARRRLSVDESRDDIPVGTRNFHLRSRIEHQEAFAVGVRLHLSHQIEIDDRRAMHALKAAGVESFLEVLHRLAQDQ